MTTYTLSEREDTYYLSIDDHLYCITRIDKSYMEYDMKQLVNNTYGSRSVPITHPMFTRICSFTSWKDLVNNYPEIFL
jgi:hypothetical protein